MLEVMALIVAAASALAGGIGASVAAWQVHVSRLPVVLVRWGQVTQRPGAVRTFEELVADGTGPTRTLRKGRATQRTGELRIRANIRNFSPFPVVLHGYEWSVRGGPGDARRVRGIDYILRPGARVALRIDLGVTDEDFMKLDYSDKLRAELRVTVSAAGAAQRDAWSGTCTISQNPFGWRRFRASDGHDWRRQTYRQHLGQNMGRCLERWRQGVEQCKRRLDEHMGCTRGRCGPGDPAGRG